MSKRLPDNLPPWTKLALADLGTHEIDGRGSNPKIEAYFDFTDYGHATDDVPWCSAFQNACMFRSGYAGTRSALARSWLTWGIAIRNPVPGCIVVFSRVGSPGSGHVAQFLGWNDDGSMRVIGGNQSDAVTIMNTSKEPLAYRLPKGWYVVQRDGQPSYAAKVQSAPAPSPVVTPSAPEPRSRIEGHVGKAWASEASREQDTAPAYVSPPVAPRQAPPAPIQDREFSEDEQQEAADRLRRVGSRTMSHSDAALGWIKRTFGSIFGVGATKAGLGLFGTFFGFWDEIRPAIDKAKEFAEWSLSNMWLVAAIGGAFVIYHLLMVQHARVDDDLTGVNTNGGNSK
jgi:uncharacterized protein (TIGR02594 family)